ncbi:cytidine deaminase 1-like [Nymphaea colorata]|uniref:cytidine deaminase 1-like n=1 Tax=Nymphaea colorata TaxID=210225 RepID=UPI00129DB8B6|nr:cytidine deaminase 1-like [Nymphaea colorata]
MASVFVIEREEVESLGKKTRLTTLQLLASLVPQAKSKARPPVSNYRVGAVGLGASGRIFFGVNLEFPGLPLSQSVHAEQFLVANAALHGESALTHIAVSTTPCGHCRQFLQEIRSAPEISVLVTGDGDTDGSAHPDPGPDDFRRIAFFLPHRFGPRDLLHGDVPLLLENRNNRLAIASSAADSLPVEDRDLLHSALRAANRSHAPYSGCPSAVALRAKGGRVFAGSYIESAAHNPGLHPIQAALVAFVAGGGGGYEEIERAVLVERKGAVVAQEGVVRLVLASVAPTCSFSVVHCQPQISVDGDGDALNHN